MLHIMSLRLKNTVNTQSKA
jgi:hypothetical protein